MVSRGGAVLLLILLLASPAAAIGDDSTPNATENGTLDGASSADRLLSAENETIADGGGTTADGDGTIVDADTETGSALDAAGETTNATLDTAGETTNATLDTAGETTNATLDTADETTNATVSTAPTAGAISVEDLETFGAESVEPVEAGRSGTTDRPPTGATAARDRRLAATDPDSTLDSRGAADDGGSTAGGSAAGVATGALLAGLVARGTLLADGSAATLTTAAVASPRTVRSTLDRLLRALVPLRYSRHDGSDPLEHEDRARLLETVEAQPGSYLTAVAEATDVPLSTARHHLRVLERENLVERTTVRGRRRLFPAHAEAQELAAALADEATAAVLDALARVGPCSTSELADELDRSPSTMSHHLSRLDDDGLVVRERDGRATVSRLAPEAADVLDEEPSDAAAASALADD